MNALITGASKGIGKAIAIELAKKGYNVAICARNEQHLAELELMLKVYSVDVLVKKVDCSVKQQVIDFADEMLSKFKHIDVLVNNVGIFTPGSLLDENDEVFELQQQVNVNAAYYFSKKIAKVMRTQRFGHIFNICSVAAKAPVENAGSYSVTKAAMLSLNHVLRMELATHNVKVTAVIPGSTLTASWEGTTISSDKFVQSTDIAKSIMNVLSLSSGVNVDELILNPVHF